MTLAHQHLHQLEPEVRHAVLGNAGTMLTFRVEPKDEDVLAKEFRARFGPLNLMNLPNRDFYVKLMIDGTPAYHSAVGR